MKWIKWICGVLVVGLVLAVLHYTLPQRDVVQIVGTDVKRMDVDTYALFWARPDAGTNTNATRDVRFINSITKNGDPYVYRNEDTEWTWPPYLKFDSGNLNAQAQGLAKQDDTWVAITHYGWRIKLFSIFPNAVKIRQVSGPDVFLIPWFNIIFIIGLILIALLVLRLIRRFKRRHVDPITDKIENAADAVSGYADTTQENVAEQKAAVSGIFKRWFGTTK